MSSGGRGGRGGRGGITGRLTGKSGPVFQYSASDAMKKLLLSKVRTFSNGTVHVRLANVFTRTSCI